MRPEGGCNPNLRGLHRGSPGHGRWNITGAGLPDGVIRRIYYENALRSLPELKVSIYKQLGQRSE